MRHCDQGSDEVIVMTASAIDQLESTSQIFVEFKVSEKCDDDVNADPSWVSITLTDTYEIFQKQ